MSPLDLRLVSIFFYTKTIEGSRVALEALDILERQAETVEESDIIKFAMDCLLGGIFKLWRRGNEITR